MAADIVFFLAPDADTAAATYLMGPGPELASSASQSFDPDDAVMEWEVFLGAPSRKASFLDRFRRRNDRPVYVEPICNDGVGVFAVPENTVGLLAAADPTTLRGLAAHWTRMLRSDGETYLSDDELLKVVQDVARLATRTGEDIGPKLYCWHC
ncbi:hypothetical protein [Streptomyces sp. NPDC055749]